ALFLLGCDQSSGQVFNSMIALAKRILALPQRPFGLLAIGDVDDQTAYFQTLSIFVVNGTAAIFHPAHASVRPKDAILVAKFSILRNRSVYLSLRHRQIIRVHSVSPSMIIRLDAVWRDTEDREIFLGPHDGVGSYIPLPDTHTTRFER